MKKLFIQVLLLIDHNDLNDLFPINIRNIQRSVINSHAHIDRHIFILMLIWMLFVL